jgi:hypothetical protein
MAAIHLFYAHYVPDPTTSGASTTPQITVTTAAQHLSFVGYIKDSLRRLKGT